MNYSAKIAAALAPLKKSLSRGVRKVRAAKRGPIAATVPKKTEDIKEQVVPASFYDCTKTLSHLVKPRQARQKHHDPRPRPLVIPVDFFPGLTAYKYPRSIANIWALVPSPKPPSIYPLVTKAAMHSFVQILSTPTADTPGTSLVLSMEKKRYLFGHVAEGTQRLAIQRKVGLAKMMNLFITGPIDSHSTGGLMGMILTVADINAAFKAHLRGLNEERAAKGKPPKAKNDASPETLDIHGGKNLVHMLASARNFVLRKTFPVRPHEIREDGRSQDPFSSAPDWQDELIRVWNVPLTRSASPAGKKRRRSGSSLPDVEPEQDAAKQDKDDLEIKKVVVSAMFESEGNVDQLWEMKLSEVTQPAAVFIKDKDGRIRKYEGAAPDGKNPCPDPMVLVRKPLPTTKQTQIPQAAPSVTSMCYIVKEQQRRGKFNADAATGLGVPKQMNKILAAGESITLDNGTVVTPDMVMFSPEPALGFAILDVRDEKLLASLLSRPEWSNPEIMAGIQGMYWILDVSLQKNNKLAAFMAHHSNVKHIVFGNQITPNSLAFEDSALHTWGMNRIDPERFPLPVFSNAPTEVPSALSSVTEVGQGGKRQQLAPKGEFQNQALVEYMGAPIDPLEALELGLENASEVVRLADEARARIAESSFIERVEMSEEDIPNRDAEIITLGTGSSLPSKGRNVSATLIRVPGYGSLLLDCGEGTLGQLRRTLGVEGADEVLKELRVIYISHMHADHHLGTMSVLARLGKLQTPEMATVTLIHPPQYSTYLSDVQGLQHLARVQSLERTSTRIRTHELIEWNRNREWIREKTGLAAVEACVVDHCMDAMAAVFTWPSGLKIAYSGDCRPSHRFANLGRGAHLLIHEATFDSELSGDALAKRHSTVAEALDIGRQMKARRILLTHFSQRYPKMANITDEMAKQDQTVLFAFDCMRVKMGGFKYAAEFLPALRLMNEEEEAKEEEVKNDEDDEIAEKKVESREKRKEGKNKKQKKEKTKKGGPEENTIIPAGLEEVVVLDEQAMERLEVESGPKKGEEMIL
ncbi:hypothetical protein B0H66DRAFT_554838 [Apodospora peruviana]|uniref:ribonuclease Z n=1 Tax=Apodospora peruviana TaxID=516989 RepID=A0AAE0ICQ2_9PEZI|nr:hypothetical protein B0H66DRAFT_554838 [Apodospora peruviana]